MTWSEIADTPDRIHEIHLPLPVFLCFVGESSPCEFFHWRALLFFVKVVKRAFELSDPLGYEVEIE